MDPGARSYDRWRHVKSLWWNKTKGSHYFSFDWIIYGEKTRKHLQYFIINIKTSRFKIISHFGNMLNLCCYPPAMPSNAWHLPLAPLNMSDRMEYVNCACNFKTTGHSVIFAIMGALSPSWSENLPGRALTHTHTHTLLQASLLRSNSIAPPSPLLLSFSLSPVFFFYLRLTYTSEAPSIFPLFITVPPLFSLTGSLCLTLSEMSESLMNEIPFHQDATTAVTQNSICCLVCEIPLWIGALSFSPGASYER